MAVLKLPMASDLSSVGRAHTILAGVDHSFPVNLEEARGIHGGGGRSKERYVGLFNQGRWKREQMIVSLALIFIP